MNKDLESLTHKYALDSSENVYDALYKCEVKNKNKFLAEKLNCSPAFITKIFNGKSNLTVKKMIEIARAVEHDLNIQIHPQASG